MYVPSAHHLTLPVSAPAYLSHVTCQSLDPSQMYKWCHLSKYTLVIIWTYNCVLLQKGHRDLEKIKLMYIVLEGLVLIFTIVPCGVNSSPYSSLLLSYSSGNYEQCVFFLLMTFFFSETILPHLVYWSVIHIYILHLSRLYIRLPLSVCRVRPEISTPRGARGLKKFVRLKEMS